MGEQLGLLEKILKSVGPVCLLQVQEDIVVNLLIYRQHIEGEKRIWSSLSHSCNMSNIIFVLPPTLVTFGTNLTIS